MKRSRSILGVGRIVQYREGPLSAATTKSWEGRHSGANIAEHREVNNSYRPHGFMDTRG